MEDIIHSGSFIDDVTLTQLDGKGFDILLHYEIKQSFWCDIFRDCLNLRDVINEQPFSCLRTKNYICRRISIRSNKVTGFNPTKLWRLDHPGAF